MSFLILSFISLSLSLRYSIYLIMAPESIEELVGFRSNRIDDTVARSLERLHFKRRPLVDCKDTMDVIVKVVLRSVHFYFRSMNGVQQIQNYSVSPRENCAVIMLRIAKTVSSLQESF